MFAIALAPSRALRANAPLRDCLAQHRIALSATVAGAQGAVEDAHGFEQLTELMDEWSEAAAESFPTGLSEYAALFDDALVAARAPPTSGGHPRLMILGLLEACLLSFDRVLLAGPRRDGLAARGRDRRLLNRPMRAALAFRRRSGASVTRAPSRRRARSARGDPEPGKEARRRADRRVALSAAHGGCGWS